MVKALANARGTHPTLYPCIAAGHDTHPLTDAVGNTPTGTPHPVTAPEKCHHSRLTLQRLLHNWMMIL